MHIDFSIGCVLHSCHLFVVESLSEWAPVTPIIAIIRRVAQLIHRSKPVWDKLHE